MNAAAKPTQPGSRSPSQHEAATSSPGNSPGSVSANAGGPGVLLDGPDASACHVLHVGDEAFVHRMDAALKQAKLIVRASHVGDLLLALGQLARVKPHVMFVQLDMLGPLRDSGIVAVRRLAGGMQMVVVASQARKQQAIEAVEAGFDDLLLEPADAQALHRLVANATPPSSRHDEAAAERGRRQAVHAMPSMPGAELDDPWLTGHIHHLTAHAGLSGHASAAGDASPSSREAADGVQENVSEGNTAGPTSGGASEATSGAISEAVSGEASGGVSGRGGEDPFALAGDDLGDVDLLDCLMHRPDVFEALLLKLVAGRSGVAGVALAGEASQVPSGHVGAWVEHRGQKLGVLHAPPSTIKAVLVPWAQWMAHWLALHRQMGLLWQIANKDELTGAWSRRYFDRHLATVIEQAGAKRMAVTLLVFDIDNFKMYNDRYGHAAGDEILCETVRLMRSVVREHDVVARIGGDEFAVIFWDPQGPRKPDSSHPDDVRNAARRFQQAICSHHFPKLLEEAPGTLTISGGLASFPWDGHTPQTLMERADAMLLHSKSQGKNAITFGPGAARHGDPFAH